MWLERGGVPELSERIPETRGREMALTSLAAVTTHPVVPLTCPSDLYQKQIKSQHTPELGNQDAHPAENERETKGVVTEDF